MHKVIFNRPSDYEISKKCNKKRKFKLVLSGKHDKISGLKFTGPLRSITVTLFALFTKRPKGHLLISRSTAESPSSKSENGS